MKELELLLKILESDMNEVKEEYTSLKDLSNPRYPNLNGQMSVLNKYISWVKQLINNY